MNTELSLNDKILDVLNKNCEHIGGETVYGIDDFKFPEIAKEIFMLLLSEKIDLLQRLNIRHFTEGAKIMVSSTGLDAKLSELVSQLNSIKNN